MQIATSHSTIEDPDGAVRECADALFRRLDVPPSIIFLSASASYPPERLAKVLQHVAPGVAVHGGTSCMGVMTERGYHGAEGPALAMLGIADIRGAYGVGYAEFGSDPRAAAGRAVERALEQAGRPGEVPTMLWITAAPGCEESILVGIEDVVGSGVPVGGGSAADDTVVGDWAVFANGETYRDALVVTALFPSSRLAFNFHSGYEPTGQRGRVTRATDRVLHEIDGRPAAQVYDEWTGGIMAEFLDGTRRSVLSRTTLSPLGRVVGMAGGMPYYRLSHPDRIEPDGSLGLFTSMEVGDEVVLMRGTKKSLVERAQHVAAAALSNEALSPSDVAGALVIYCAGCMLTVREEMSVVVTGVRQALGGAPFLGSFTFGEQGCFVGGENRHGNLMISTLAFAR